MNHTGGFLKVRNENNSVEVTVFLRGASLQGIFHPGCKLLRFPGYHGKFLKMLTPVTGVCELDLRVINYLESLRSSFSNILTSLLSKMLIFHY